MSISVEEIENKSLNNRISELESYSAALAKTNDELREKIAKAIKLLSNESITSRMSAQQALEILTDTESQKIILKG